VDHDAPHPDTAEQPVDITREPERTLADIAESAARVSPADREAGIARVAEGAQLCADAAAAFELGAFTLGVVLTARAAEAMCEGAALLGVGSEVDRLRGVGL
jgi:hypothetical protein